MADELNLMWGLTGEEWMVIAYITTVLFFGGLWVLDAYKQDKKRRDRRTL